MPGPTDAAVYDELYRLFGLGDYVGDGSDWFKFRAGQVARIKRTREKRGAEPFELIQTARWCRKQGIWIREHWEIYEHMPAAKRAAAAEDAQRKTADVDRAIDEALDGMDPESPWFGRLIRAAPDRRREVYQQWLESSSHSPS